jgi:adenylate kinase
MVKNVPVVIFLGAPGVGKGTQALRLSQKLSIPKISTGDMLRQAQREHTELGRKVQGIMKEGRLVDDETMLDLVKDRIIRADCEHGFILDGYPRTIPQAAQLDKLLKECMQVRVFKIELPEDEIVKRVVGRRTCPTCQRTYNVFSDPPANDELCDVDNSPLFRRDDDTEETVRKRIATYNKETKPLIAHYKNRGLLQKINGRQSEEEVELEILRLVN